MDRLNRPWWSVMIRPTVQVRPVSRQVATELGTAPGRVVISFAADDRA